MFNATVSEVRAKIDLFRSVFKSYAVDLQMRLAALKQGEEVASKLYKLEAEHDGERVVWMASEAVCRSYDEASSFDEVPVKRRV